MAWDTKGECDLALSDAEKGAVAEARRLQFAQVGVMRWIARSDSEQRISILTRRIKAWPKAAMLYRGRGKPMLRKADFERALADYDQAIRLDPRDAEQYFAAWRFCGASMEDWDKAIADYTKAIGMKPD